MQISSTLTVFFEDPFWVGVIERVADGEMTVCKITFGAEPKDYEVYDFLLKHWNALRFSPPVKAEPERATHANPKRMQRLITRQLHHTGVGTKAQQALKHQQAEGKQTRKRKSKIQREEERDRQFLIKQQKKKQKHRGH